MLLNILIALYNSAYEDITENAIDEYMALVSQKTLQFVRAPDENVFIARTHALHPPLKPPPTNLPPRAAFNLIEIFCLIIPFEWWLSKPKYERLNTIVMGILYSPLLVITAFFESKQAQAVKLNRRRGEQDEDTTEEWEQMEPEVDFEAEGWSKKVDSSKPNVETEAAVLEIREVRKQLDELRGLVERIRGKGEEEGEIQGQGEAGEVDR